MLTRTLTKILKKAVKTFPAVVLTGPRQSGKTTLLKTEFARTHEYYSLEDPDLRDRVRRDPAGFINRVIKPAIIDEIQYAPELLSYIKMTIDQNRQTAGRWLLTGSQNFALMENVTESLAGRAAILSLLPFSVAERIGEGANQKSYEKPFISREKKEIKNFNLGDVLLRGCYPEIACDSKIDRQLWCGSYITTYLERDVRNIKQVGDLRQFETFLRSCAVRTGQILDLSSISREIGVSFTTAKRWLSLLEASYQVFLLYPYYQNIGKRLVKRPKIYFTDTGLVTYLLRINTFEQLVAGPFWGPIFETLVIVDFWKRFLHNGQLVPMYYLRTHDDLEIDLLVENLGKLDLFEAKATSTLRAEHVISLIRAKRDLKGLAGRATVISNSSSGLSPASGINALFVNDLLSR